MIRPARPRSGGAASAAVTPIRRDASSSTTPSARAAVTARKHPTASRCSRSKPNSAASGRSTSRTATRTSLASTASARASSRSAAASSARRRKPAQGLDGDLFASLPLPTPRPLDRAYGILITGIGGTGVITLGALARDGGAPRRQGLHGPRRHRPCAEERRGDEPRPSGAARRRTFLPCGSPLARQPAARLRPGGGGEPRRAIARVESGVTAPSSTTTCIRPPVSSSTPDIDFETGVMRQALRRPLAEDGIDFVERHRLGVGACRRFDRRQSVHARLRIPERARAARPRRHRARHRAQRRCRREQQARLSPSGRLAAHDLAPCRPCARSAAARRWMRRPQVARRPGRAPCSLARRLSECSLRAALPRRFRRSKSPTLTRARGAPGPRQRRSRATSSS